MAELGPFTSHRDEWSYRAQVDEEKKELLYSAAQQGIEMETPPAKSVVMAVLVVVAMIALLILALVSGWL